jgi:hypothetical protein
VQGTGTGLFKTHKTGTVLGIPVQIGSLYTQGLGKIKKSLLLGVPAKKKFEADVSKIQAKNFNFELLCPVRKRNAKTTMIRYFMILGC